MWLVTCGYITAFFNTEKLVLNVMPSTSSEMDSLVVKTRCPYLTRQFILYIGLHKSRHEWNQWNCRMWYIKNRAETTSLSSAFTSLPCHVTEVISSLGWTRAWILYFRKRTEQFLKRCTKKGYFFWISYSWQVRRDPPR